jgi:hypothetical protein
VLSVTDPATPCWTWSPRKDVGFVARRMAQETVVHGWDARAAAGEQAVIAPGLAVDGIDEFFEYWLDAAAHEGEPVGGSVHLHATDAEGGEWQVTPDGRALVVRREHAKGDAAVRASASDLLLLLWRRKRPTDAGVEVFGDEAVLARLLAHTNLD